MLYDLYDSFRILIFHLFALCQINKKIIMVLNVPLHKESMVPSVLSYENATCLNYSTLYFL